MSETMSSPRTDWPQFYQHNPPAKHNQIPDTTTVTATSIGSTSSGLRLEGGVSKPIRRRSRASRRTPTTLLNTDTANFRAMVQQFTGGPLAPFVSSNSNTVPYPRTNFGFGLGTGQQMVNPNAGMIIPRSGYNMLHVQQQQQQQQQFQHQQHHQFMFPLNNINDHDHHSYIQRLEQSRILTPDVSGGGGFSVDGFSSSRSAVVIGSNSSSSENISEDNYMF